MMGKICFAVCMYLQQIDHLIGKITEFGVQFLIIWGAFHCMRDHWKCGHNQNSSSGSDQFFSSTVLPHTVMQSSGSRSDMVAWLLSKISLILVPSFFKICTIIRHILLEVVVYHCYPVLWQLQVVPVLKKSSVGSPPPIHSPSYKH